MGSLRHYLMASCSFMAIAVRLHMPDERYLNTVLTDTALMLGLLDPITLKRARQ